MKSLGVTESFKLKRQVVISATEAAEMIIRCAFLFDLGTGADLFWTEWMIFYDLPRVNVRLYDRIHGR